MEQMVQMEQAMQNAQAARKPEINVIPATVRSVESGGQIKKQRNLRVAAYCRVSTGDESQQTSYTTQKRFYTQLITSKPGWTMAGIYADEAISGTSRAKRKQFNEMMKAALSGKMDYIVTKSISRFARNTIDTLDCVRQLRQLNPPVGIYFEKENIDTLDATGELILTILSALAQDESRSISDNIRWSIQRKFQRGEAMVDLSRMLGYDKGSNGEWLINPEQAEIVRYIFDRFVCGASSNAIAKELNAMGKTTVKGSIWRADSVLYILRNEKYVGDCENQKYVTKNFLTHEATRNNGEVAKYYVNDHHVAIIDRLTWNKAQAMLLERGAKANDRASGNDRAKSNSEEQQKRRGSRASVFTNLMCGEEYHGRTCGEKLFRIGYNNALPGYTDNRSLAAEGINPEGYSERYYYYYPVWRCTKNAQGASHGCTSGSTYECALEQSFMENLYWLKRDLEANGDDSWLMRQFAAACERMERASGRNSYSSQRLQTVEMQIRELEEKLNKTVANQVEAMRVEALEKTAEAKHTLENGSTDDVPVDIMSGISTVGLGTQWFCGDEINSDSEAAVYEELANDIRDRIADLKSERDALELEQGATTIARKNFDFFVRCLKALPETNFAGMKMNVNGLDVQGSLFRDMDGKAIAGKRSSARSGHIKITEEKLAAAPDYLNFEKGIYTAFIKSGVVKGDTVEYQTNFGVMLTTTGNSRNLSSFLGFRRANPDGTVMFLDEKWKVSGRSVCYTRKKLKNKDKRRESMTEEKRKKGEDMLRWIEQRSMGN